MALKFVEPIFVRSDRVIDFRPLKVNEISIEYDKNIDNRLIYNIKHESVNKSFTWWNERKCYKKHRTMLTYLEIYNNRPKDDEGIVTFKENFKLFIELLGGPLKYFGRIVDLFDTKYSRQDFNIIGTSDRIFIGGTSPKVDNAEMYEFEKLNLRMLNVGDYWVGAFELVLSAPWVLFSFKEIRYTKERRILNEILKRKCESDLDKFIKVLKKSIIEAHKVRTEYLEQELWCHQA